MKKYHRESRTWVSAEEFERLSSLKKKELCIGKKPHDFILVLPDYYTYDDTYEFDAEKLYKLLEEEQEYQENLKERMKDIGVHPKYSRTYRPPIHRYYQCSICNKKKSE